MSRRSVPFVFHGLRVRAKNLLHQLANRIDPIDAELAVALSRAIIEAERIAEAPVAIPPAQPLAELVAALQALKPPPVPPADEDKLGGLACAACKGIAAAFGEASTARIAQAFRFCGTGPFVVSAHGFMLCRLHALQSDVQLVGECHEPHNFS